MTDHTRCAFATYRLLMQVEALAEENVSLKHEVEQLRAIVDGGVCGGHKDGGPKEHADGPDAGSQ